MNTNWISQSKTPSIISKYHIPIYAILNFAIEYIKSNLKNPKIVHFMKATDNFKAEINALIAQPPNIYHVIFYQNEQEWGAAVWNVANAELLVLNDKPELTALFNQSEIKKRSLPKEDVFSCLLLYIINIVNYGDLMYNLKPKQYSRLPNFFKWVLLKYNRMKVINNSYSRMLDELNFSRSINQDDNALANPQKKRPSEQPPPQAKFESEAKSFQSQAIRKESKNEAPISFSLSALKSQQHSAAQKSASSLKISQLSQEESGSFKDVSQLNRNDFSDIIDQMRREILQKSKVQDFRLDAIGGNRYFLDHLPKQYNRDNVEQVFKIKLEDLDQMMRDQVESKKMMMDDPDIQNYQDLQFLLNYYYQHNPAQYKLLLDQYQDVIHQSLFEGMGFSAPKSQGLARESLTRSGMNVVQQGKQHPQLINFNPKGMQAPAQAPAQAQAQLSPQIYKEEVIAHMYDIKITRHDLEQLKQKYIMSPQVMDFYFCHLNESNSRALIMPLKFYQDLSQTNYQQSRHYTDKYYGKNHTIFDLFDKLLIPIKASQYEYVGVYFDFLTKSIYYINTLERKNRIIPVYKELINNPVIQVLIKFVEIEYNQKVMRAFNVVNWRILEFQSQFAQQFNHSGVVLSYVFEALIFNRVAQFENGELKQFVQRVLDAIRKGGKRGL